MKSQHRHDLQTNELGKLLERITPFFEKYATTRNVLILCGAIVAAAAVIYRVRDSRALDENAWTNFMSCQSAEDFAKVADKFEGTDVGAWARLNEGEMLLQQGIDLCFTDKAGGMSDLKQAEKAFDGLLKATSVPDKLRERALMGKARFLETASNGDTQSAIAAYSKFVKDFPDSALAQSAKKRIETLEQGHAQEFYAWFHKQNPKPEDRKKPRDSGSDDVIKDFESDPLALPPIPDALRPWQPLDDSAPSKPTSTDGNSEPPPPLPEGGKTDGPSSKKPPEGKSSQPKTPPSDADSKAAPKAGASKSGAK